MHCTNPDEYLMQTLQALALPADELREYLDDDVDIRRIENRNINHSWLLMDYKCWKKILQGRDDWAPTSEQQYALARVEAAMEGVELPPDPEFFDLMQIYLFEKECLSATFLLMDQPGWLALRESCREALAAFGWARANPPEYDYKLFNRLSNMPDLTISERLTLAITRLNIIRRRPAMNFARSIEEANTFLAGFSEAIAAIGYSKEKEFDRMRSEIARGWEPNSISPVPQMQKRGWSTEAIIDELFCCEIEAIIRMLGEEG